MKVTVANIAQAVVDAARMQPVEEIGVLADAAAEVLKRHGLLSESRKFLTLVDRLWQKQEAVTSVKLISPKGDSGQLKKQLQAAVEAALNRRCVIEETADPTIIGGLVMRVGDERFDATVRTALNELSDRLAEPIPMH